MIAFPNAKINIGLQIVGRRNDGYHELVTAMVPVGWQDILEIVPAKGETSSLTVSGRRIDCPPEKNIVMKAYQALNEITPLPPVDIFLRKIIPDKAGLGGGSADASFALSTLNQLFALNLTLEQLAEIATGIGADCPQFIFNRPMLATGTGTTLSPIDLPQLSGRTILIIKPDFSISTAEAYANVTPCKPATPLTELLSKPIDQWKDSVANDFETALSDRFPQIGHIKQQLYDSEAIYASLSGSGSAVYGIFDNDKMAETARAQFADAATFISRL